MYTRAEYERVFSYPPDPLIWEDEEERFRITYTKRVYVNLRRLCLAQALKLRNNKFLVVPKNYRSELKIDKPSAIQIITNRENRKAIASKGKLFKWRRFYLN